MFIFLVNSLSTTFHSKEKQCHYVEMYHKHKILMGLIQTNGSSEQIILKNYFSKHSNN